MTTPFSQIAFLVEPCGDHKNYYRASALHKVDGAYEPILPPQVGGGITPIAALTRIVTVLREQEPTPDHLRQALIAAMVNHGVSTARLAKVVDYSEKRLNAYFNGAEDFNHATVLAMADAVKIPHSLFKSQLREVQRREDSWKEPSV